MIETKLYKNNQSDIDKYIECVVWCNANNATIEDKGEYYEVVEITGIPPCIPTKEEKVAKLDLEYERNKQQLMQYYLEFSITDNIEGIEAIKAELETLNQQYDNDLKALKGSE